MVSAVTSQQKGFLVQIHPFKMDFIHSFCFSFSIPSNPSVWSRGGGARAGAYPSGHRAKGGVHPGQVSSPSQGHIETNETNNHARSVSYYVSDNLHD